MARSELVELRLAVELLEVKNYYLMTQGAVGPAEALAWGKAFAVRWRRPFHLSRVCRVWGISRATVYRHHKNVRRQRGPRSSWTDDELVRRLRELMRNSPFPAERYRKFWHRLRLQGVHVSKERVRRLIKKHKLLPAYGSIVAARPNELWGIDAARVVTTDRMSAFVIFVIDHCTGECLAIDVITEETPLAWARLVRSAVALSFGNVSSGIARGLRIRCDNHPVFRDRDFCRPLAMLGIRTSYTWPLNPRANGLAERFVRTLRDNRLSVRFFATVHDLAAEMACFRRDYNDRYILQRWAYRTPAEVRDLFDPA